MNHISLFSGIGGFDLAAQRAGWNNVAHCEKDPYCQKILKRHFPNSILHENIKTTDFTVYHRLINCVSGGFPCQPYSQSGRRKGTEDDRHLWPEKRRAVREIQPPWVTGENVRGLTNWNAGVVFDEIQADLEAEGYEVTPFLLPACGIDAPHQRYRIFFIAFNQKFWHACNTTACDGPNTDSSIRSEGGMHQKKLLLPGQYTGRGYSHDIRDTWKDYPSESPVCRTSDGIPNRVDRVRALGNAVVPDLAYIIFDAINQFEALLKAEYEKGNL